MGYIVPQMEQSSPGIDPTDLLVFARVAEFGSFSRAAERLGLPKSTVSRRIAALEARVGERLLVRTTRRQTLTELGAALLEHARQIASEVDAATALRDHRQSAPSGRLRVSMPADVANLVLADTLAAFVALHPGITLELDLSPRRVDLLGEGFDAAVRIGALPDDGLLVARRLTVFAQGLYAAPGYLAERGVPRAPADLADHDAVRLLGGDGGPVLWTLTRGSERWEGVPPGRAAANSPELLMRLVHAGAGIAAAPEVFARPLQRRGELRRVLVDWRLPSDTAWVVFPGRRLMPAKTRAFVDMLQAALGGPERPAGEPV
jgi:DNA-binding transcriptional LysR family regulator